MTLARPGLTRSRSSIAVASVLLVLVFVWILNRGGLPLLPPKGTLDHVAVAPLVGFVLLLTLHMLARYARCQLLLAPFAQVPFRRTMTINGISMALITFLPLRLGEFARPAMLREKGHVSAWAVTGTVAAERILDGLAYSALLLIGLALASPHEPVPDHIGSLPVHASLIPRGARVVAAAFGLAFIVMILFYRFRDRARALTETVVGVVSHRLATRLADIVSRLSDGLSFLMRFRYSVPYLAVTVLAVVAHVWALELLAEAVGIPELTFVQAAVLLGVLAIGFTMPNAPGFFGSIQLALYAGLASYVSPAKVAHEGAAFVFVFYVAYLAIVLALTLVSLVVEYAFPSSQRE